MGGAVAPPFSLHLNLRTIAKWLSPVKITESRPYKRRLLYTLHF
nr:MAG TPA: hypothetical protein [Caudoviricetes sp.]